MVGCSSPAEVGVWRGTPARHPVKAKSATLGATRSRLIQVLRHLGLYTEKIAAQLQHKRETVLLLDLEEERLERIREEQEVARRSEERRVARLAEEEDASRHQEALLAAEVHEQEQFARLAEEQRADRLFKEKLAYESMSEAQQAAWRLEEEIVSWLTSSEADT